MIDNIHPRLEGATALQALMAASGHTEADATLILAELGKNGFVIRPSDDFDTAADILAKAVLVFGSRDAAKQWFAAPAIGLDQQRPGDLITTPAGAATVMDFLERLEHGVYT
jgi:putative toxin-antitoxin system antitoxin component (TIGR02293 family)